MIQKLWGRDSSAEELLIVAEELRDDLANEREERAEEADILTDQLLSAVALLRRCAEHVPEELRAEIEILGSAE